MSGICIFAGTVEGRKLTEFLSGKNVKVSVCVATEYGESLIDSGENINVFCGRMDTEKMTEFISENDFDCVIDATHPYAQIVTQNILSVCKSLGKKYIRLKREEISLKSECLYFENTEKAAEFLNTAEGNILLTTGSKELGKYSTIKDFQNRVYARVLPMEESLDLCRKAGMQSKNIIAMQGPFTKELNNALINSINAKYIVTKDTGNAGGFIQKVQSAEDTGAKLVVIGRPLEQTEGISYSEVVDYLCKEYSLTYNQNVYIVGIGTGNKNSLTLEAEKIIKSADCIIGAKRMLDSVDVNVQKYKSISPKEISDYIYSNKQFTNIVVLMSGDTGFFSGSKKLISLLDKCKVKIIPGISSLSSLSAKTGISYDDAVCVSAHGRNESVIPSILKNNKTFVLVGGDDGVNNLCRDLIKAGLENAQVTVGENLGYKSEKITFGIPENLKDVKFSSLSAVIIQHSKAVCEYQGIADEMFTRGYDDRGKVIPMTKSEVRAVCLSKLGLSKDSVCWDIGAGSGSVTVEMALQAYKGKVFAVEHNKSAFDLLNLNKEKFFADNIVSVLGSAPKACFDLPAPTHIFIGGSSGGVKEITDIALSKNPNVKIVATAVSLETTAQLTQMMKEFSHSECVNITVAKSNKAGSYHLMNGQNPIYIFTFQG